MTAARIEAIATWLPPRVRTTAQAEERLAAESPAVSIPAGLIRRVTGVERVREAEDDVHASDLAANAARELERRRPGVLDDVDLLIFGSATQDLIEPATSHLAAHALGLACPVFDVKNACNSLLAALEVADALIRAGSYRRILVVSGEKPSAAARWSLGEARDMLRAFPGYTMGDAGAACLVTRAESDDEGHRILGAAAIARSEHWSIGTLGGGGTRDPDLSRGGRWFDMDGGALFAAFDGLDDAMWAGLIARSGTSVERARVVAIHQVALPHLEAVRRHLGVREGQLVVTIRDHGNIASATLPRQLELAEGRGLLAPGDEALLIGLAGGISVAAMGLRW